MHQPLLRALSMFDKGQLLAGTRLFHGSLDRTNRASDRFHPLSGTRKWLSESIVTASEYAYDGKTNDNGITLLTADRYLWVCEVIADVPALIGSQFTLRENSPWQPWEFPSEFPSEFAAYAHDILGLSPCYALLDHIQEGLVHEVLMANPAKGLKILEQIDLPESKTEAQAYLITLFPDAA